MIDATTEKLINMYLKYSSSKNISVNEFINIRKQAIDEEGNYEDKSFHKDNIVPNSYKRTKVDTSIKDNIYDKNNSKTNDIQSNKKPIQKDNVKEDEQIDYDITDNEESNHKMSDNDLLNLMKSIED